MTELWNWFALDVVAESSKQGRADSPSYFISFLGLFVSCHGLLSADDLMESSMDISSSDVLKSYTRLKKEATIWHLYLKFLVISEPHKQAWVSRLSMDSQEADIIMESSEDRAVSILCKVRACWSKEMGATLKALGELILF